MRAHKLKIWPEPFAALVREEKCCDVRKTDRDFRAGDFVMFIEFDPKTDKLTGRYVCRRVGHVTTADAVPRALVDGHAVLSLQICAVHEEDALLGKESAFLAKPEWLAP
jgi:hypothetical protein